MFDKSKVVIDDDDDNNGKQQQLSRRSVTSGDFEQNMVDDRGTGGNNDTDDDTYWNFSFANQLSFEEKRQDESIVIETGDYRINEPKPSSKPRLSVADLISPANLDLMLKCGNGELDSSGATVTGFVHGCFVRVPGYEIGRFRAFEDKRDLLSLACRLMDGNLIKYILVFLKRSLDRKLFAELLAKHEIARKHFVRLQLEFDDVSFDTFESLLEVVMVAGDRSNASIGFQQFNLFTNQIDLLSKRIEICTRLANYTIFSANDRSYLLDYVKFLEFGQKNNILGQDLAPVALLVNLCLEYVTSASTKHEQFTKLLSISRRQFQWSIFNVYCNQNCWSSALNLLKREGHFRSTGTFNSNEFAPSKVIIQLAKHKAPDDIPKTILPLIAQSTTTIKPLERNKCRLIADNYFPRFVLIFHYFQPKSNNFDWFNNDHMLTFSTNKTTTH